MSEHQQLEAAVEPVRGRPRFPAGYGIGPEETPKMATWPEVAARLAAARNYWLSTTRPDGRPHAAPVWGLWLDGAFYFATDRASQKGRNLAANPALAVHLESGDEVVILEGTAELVTRADTLLRFVEAYDEKYQVRPEVGSGAPVYRLRLRTALSWLEQDFPETATRFSA